MSQSLFGFMKIKQLLARVLNQSEVENKVEGDFLISKKSEIFKVD